MRKVHSLLRIAILAMLMIFPALCRAQTVTVSLTVTNITTNGMTFTLNGNTRTFTNNVVSPSTQVLTNADATGCGSKTNLFNAIAANGFLQVRIQDGGSNKFTLSGNCGLSMVASVSAGWATFSYSTNQCGTLIALVGPVANLPSATGRTNVASDTVGNINAVENTNVISESSVAAGQLLGTNKTQLVSGNTTFIAAALRSTNALEVSPAIVSGTNTGNAFTSPGSASGSEQFGNGAAAGAINSTAVGFNAAAGVPNGSAFGENAQAIGNFGTAIGTGSTASGLNSVALGASSQATDTASMAIGISANSSGLNSIAIGANSVASDNNTIALGNSANAPAMQGTAIGKSATATTNGTALGYNANAAFTNSTALGSGAATTAPNQVMLGTAGQTVVSLGSNIVGSTLYATGSVTTAGSLFVTGGAAITGAVTNLIHSGRSTYPAASDIAFARYSITTLANGANADVAIGTNVFVEVSGPGAPFSVNGFANGYDGKLLLLLNQTGFTMTIANESGVDATTANRIRTTTGGDISTAANSLNAFVYSGNAARWILLNAPNAAAGIQSLVFTNGPTPTVIGSVGYIPASLITNNFLVVDQWQVITNPANHSLTLSNFVTGSNALVLSTNGAVTHSGIVTNLGAFYVSGAMFGNGSTLTNGAGNRFLSVSNDSGTNLSFYPPNSTYGNALTFQGPVGGLGTNINLGEVWASDFGFSYTNSAAGNSNAFNLAVQALTNMGGGILRYGSKFTNWNGAAQVINITGDHILPQMAYPSRIKIKGDGVTIINFTGTSTTNAVFFGQFDAEDVLMTGPRTLSASDVYPYTNLVAFLEIGFWDPQLKSCYAKGFGQGLAAVQTGSFRGMQLIGCHFEGNDIGVALGDACDQTLLKGTDCRLAFWGLDMGCIVPLCTNAFPALTGVTGTTNVGPSRFVRVDGGIWDYITNASIVIGKGYLQAGFYAGNEHNYQMCLGHPTNMISIAGAPGAYQNENGGSVVDLNGCWWVENDVSTNIFVTPQASGQPVLKIKNTFMGGNYGVVGLVSYIEWDQNMQNPFASTNYLPVPGIANGFYYPYANMGGVFQAPQTYGMGFDEAGGAYANGTPLYSIDYHTGTSDVLPLWRVHNTDFSRGDRMYVQIDSLGNNTYGLDLHNTQINNDSTNASAYMVLTNTLTIDQWSIGTNPANHALVITNTSTKANTILGTNGYLTNGWSVISTNAAPLTVVSNFAPSNGLLFTNLSGADVAVMMQITLHAASTTSSGASANANEFITNNGTGYQLQQTDAVQGSMTNDAIQTPTFFLGPGDTVKFTTSSSGASSVTYSANAQMVTVP